MDDRSSPRPGLSALDLAIVRAGGTSRQALLDTESAARHCDRLGFTRFWVAEHHNLPGVASTSPAVLIAHLAARTNTLRLGSGGVMLPNHTPLVVAEQFALLEALHPGRIDLGIGRAPGTDRRTASLLRRGRREEADEFPGDLLAVMHLLGDTRGDPSGWEEFAATPVAESHPDVMVLGSSVYSGQLAGMLGLPYAYAHHFETGQTQQAVQQYRQHYQPSVRWPEPHLIVTISALAAPSAAEAEERAAPALLRRYGLRTGRRIPLLSPAEARSHPDYAAAEQRCSERIVGTADAVAAGLADLARRLGAHELMLAMPTFDVADRLESYELIHAAWQRATESAAS